MQLLEFLDQPASDGNNETHKIPTFCTVQIETLVEEMEPVNKKKAAIGCRMKSTLTAL